MQCIFVYPVVEQLEHLDGGNMDRQIHGKEMLNWFVA